MKWWQRRKEVSCLRIAVLVVSIFVLGGCRDFDDTPNDRATLQKMCDPVRSVPAAIEAHKAAHGSYPLSIDDLDPALPGSLAAVAALKASNGFVYSSAGDAFSIYRKLNWDGGIVFSSMRPEWVYSLNEDKVVFIY